MLWGHYVRAMWLSEHNGHPLANQYSLCTCGTIYPLSFSEALHCVWTVIDDFFLYFLKSCKTWMTVGWLETESQLKCLHATDRIHPTVQAATLLTSDTLHCNCFVFRSSTLYNLNTVDMAYKQIWPYLIKMDSWFHPWHSPTPSRLTCSEILQPRWLQGTGTF